MKTSWADLPCYVVASGPSLTKEVAGKIRAAKERGEANVVAVNDAYRLVPCADVLYAADFGWWRRHDGARDFAGERWTSHSYSVAFCDDKSQVAGIFDLNFVDAVDGAGFSTNGKCIHYGGTNAHSGFQAVNFALMKGARRVVLVGFDYGYTKEPHFFGWHDGLRNATDANYREMAKAYDSVVTDAVVNATPASNLKRFPFVDLDDEIERHRRVHRHGAEPHAAADRLG